MATAYRVLKNTAKAGNVIIGAGCYAAVLEHLSNCEKAIKIGNSSNDPWLEYYERVIQPLQGNPHVPRIETLYVDHQNDYYVANMERLQSTMYDDFDTDGGDEDFNYNLKEELADDIDQYIKGEIKWKHFKRTWEDYPQIVDLPAMRQLMDAILDATDALTAEDQSEIIDNDVDLELYNKLDLHSGNIMFRNNTVVITDPWCGVLVDDHPSMDNYIEESEDKAIYENYCTA